MMSDRVKFLIFVSDRGFVAARDEVPETGRPRRTEDIQHVIALYDGEINEQIFS